MFAAPWGHISEGLSFRPGFVNAYKTARSARRALPLFGSGYAGLGDRRSLPSLSYLNYSTQAPLNSPLCTLIRAGQETLPIRQTRTPGHTGCPKTSRQFEPHLTCGPEQSPWHCANAQIPDRLDDLASNHADHEHIDHCGCAAVESSLRFQT